MRQAWVDFNDIHDGRATTLMKFVEDGVDVHVGGFLLVGDYDGNLCRATVTGIEGQIVQLSLDPNTFRASKSAVAASA